MSIIWNSSWDFNFLIIVCQTWLYSCNLPTIFTEAPPTNGYVKIKPSRTVEVGVDESFFSIQLVGGILPTVRMRTNCIEVEQKNAKQNIQTWLEGLLTIREYQNFWKKVSLLLVLLV